MTTAIRPLADCFPPAPAHLAPLASLVPATYLKGAFIRRSRDVRYERAHYDQQPELQRRITKLIVEVNGGPEQTLYMVWFGTSDLEVPSSIEYYRDLADATTAYQRLF